MRLSFAAVISGTLGSLAQIAVNAVNYLRVQLQGHGDAETDAGKAFIAGWELSAVVGEYGYYNLFNAAGSGKTVYVDSVTYGSTQGTNADFSVRLTTASSFVDRAAVQNKDFDGAALTTHIYASTAVDGGTGTEFAEVGCGPHDTRTLVFDPPIRLDPGRGLAMRSYTTAIQSAVIFQGREY